MIRQPEVVGVEEGDDLTTGQLQADVSGRRHPPVGPPAVVEAQTPGVEGLEDLAGTVCGAVVDNDQLEVAVGLRHDAGDGPPDQLAPLESRDQHRDCGGFALVTRETHLTPIGTFGTPRLLASRPAWDASLLRRRGGT